MSALLWPTPFPIMANGDGVVGDAAQARVDRGLRDSFDFSLTATVAEPRLEPDGFVASASENKRCNGEGDRLKIGTTPCMNKSAPCHRAIVTNLDTFAPPVVRSIELPRCPAAPLPGCVGEGERFERDGAVRAAGLGNRNCGHSTSLVRATGGLDNAGR
jgi:hypothetical protein